MSEKKKFASSIDAEVFKKLKHLSVDIDSSIEYLLEEAIKDLLAKHEKKGKDKTRRETS